MHYTDNINGSSTTLAKRAALDFKFSNQISRATTQAHLKQSNGLNDLNLLKHEDMMRNANAISILILVLTMIYTENHVSF